MKVARVIAGLLFAVALLALPGLVSAQAGAAVSGTLTIRERVLLPSNTVVTVQIAEVRTGAPAAVIAEQRFTTNGAQPPFRYTVSYDASRVNPNNQYIVQANMSVNGQINFVTAQPYRVLTGGAPSNVDLLLVSTSGRLPNTGSGTLPLLLAGLALVAAVTVFVVRRVLVQRANG